MTIEEKINTINSIRIAKKELQELLDIIEVKDESYVTLKSLGLEFKKEIPTQKYYDTNKSIKLIHPNVLDEFMDAIKPIITERIIKLDNKLDELIK